MEQVKRPSDATEWISVMEVPSYTWAQDEPILEEPFYTRYPNVEKSPDKLPPDYPALLSLLFSVISICWCVWGFSLLSDT